MTTGDNTAELPTEPGSVIEAESPLWHNGKPKRTLIARSMSGGWKDLGSGHIWQDRDLRNVRVLFDAGKETDD
jgi:hypothetical protein